MSILELTAAYNLITCANCGIHFAVPVLFYKKRQDDHEPFYCPNKHGNYYPQKSDCEAAKELNERLLAQINSKNDKIQQLENSRRALKAHITIKKKKIKEILNELLNDK